MIAGVASALGPMGVLVALHQSPCDVLENALGPVGVPDWGVFNLAPWRA